MAEWSTDGVFCFLSRNEELKSYVAATWGRENAAVKIFHQPAKGAYLDDYLWGRKFRDEPGFSSLLINASRVQNIIARHGLAPRVYALFFLFIDGQYYPAQAVEDMGSDLNLSPFEMVRMYDKIAELCKQFDLQPCYEDAQRGNMVGGKWVDFQGFDLLPTYKDRIKNNYIERVQWAGNTYQTIPELGIHGFRSNSRDQLFYDVDFKGKSVVDIGCSGGEFCRLASSRGAKTVIGYDLPNVVEAAFEVNNYMGYFNIDLVGTNLNESIIEVSNPDIVFYMSMNRHIGLQPYVFDAETLIYEHNGNESADETVAEVAKKFKSYRDLGMTGDYDDRHTYVFTK